MRTIYDIERCKEALVELELHQKDLAEEGLSESAISKFFRGEPVDHKRTAAPIIRKLGLKMWGKNGVARNVHDEQQVEQAS